MYQHMLRMYKYVLDTDQYILVCTWCVPVHTWMYSTEACLTGFSGAQRDANTRMPDVPSTHRFAVLWYILVHTSTYSVHTRTYLVCTEYVQGHTKNDTVVLLCCSCAGYCTGCSTISLLHRGTWRSPWCCLGGDSWGRSCLIGMKCELLLDEYVLVHP
jgi:hypothetical protein